MPSSAPRLFLTVVFIVIVGGLFLYATDFRVRRLDAHAEAASTRGMEWLLTQSAQTIADPTAIWTLHELNTRFCKDPILTDRIMSFSTSGALTPARKAYHAKRFAHDSKPPPLSELESYDRLLVSALYCKERPVPEEILKEIYTVEGATGYVLTHRYLAALYLIHEDCAPRGSEKALARALIREQRNEGNVRQIDLYAERVASLMLGGISRSRAEPWLTTLIEKQNEDGGWPFSSQEHESNVHTTALATLALALFAGECPNR